MQQKRAKCLSLTCPGTQYTRRDEARNTWKLCREMDCLGLQASLAVKGKNKGKKKETLYLSRLCKFSSGFKVNIPSKFTPYR